MTTLATCWSMTINNPTPNDWVLVQHYNGEYIRTIVHTLEEGGEETEHIQAWFKLMRQQRLSFVKKLFPRGHFKPITSDEYNRNCREYAQKNDETTRGAHVIHYNETIPDVVQFLRKMVEEALCLDRNYEKCATPKDFIDTYYDRDMPRYMDEAERKAIVARPFVAKLIVSPTYARIKKLYLREIVQNVVDQYYKNADDDEREGGGESELHQAVSIDSASSEEEDCEEDSEADEGSDAGCTTDSEGEC